MHFDDRPQDFITEEKKVNFAFSYLTGVAKEYFNPDILIQIQNPFALAAGWHSNFQAFITALSLNFGPFDPAGAAQEELANLDMDSAKPISHYIGAFNAAAVLTLFNDAALHYFFWKGLTP